MTIWQKIVQWFNKTFRGYKYTNVGQFIAEKKYLNKKRIIKEIVLVTSKLNGTPAVIDTDYIKELRETGKKALLKALTVLNVAYTKKLMEGKNA